MDDVSFWADLASRFDSIDGDLAFHWRASIFEESGSNWRSMGVRSARDEFSNLSRLALAALGIDAREQTAAAVWMSRVFERADLAESLGRAGQAVTVVRHPQNVAATECRRIRTELELARMSEQDAPAASRDADIGRRVREGGRRGRATVAQTTRPEINQLTAKILHFAGTLQKGNPAISNRELARRIAPKVDRSESTVRALLARGGQPTPS